MFISNIQLIIYAPYYILIGLALRLNIIIQSTYLINYEDT